LKFSIAKEGNIKMSLEKNYSGETEKFGVLGEIFLAQNS
jgi:hypothetical protein